jgi:glycosyltransferase involved in cell wall biosynthesis
MAEGNDILVSISCLVYNQVKFVRQNFRWVLSLKKTNFRFEVLVNDDCSTDGTTDIIREYEKELS